MDSVGRRGQETVKEREGKKGKDSEGRGGMKREG